MAEKYPNNYRPATVADEDAEKKAESSTQTKPVANAEGEALFARLQVDPTRSFSRFQRLSFSRLLSASIIQNTSIAIDPDTSKNGEPLPSNWYRGMDQRGRQYYYNDKIDIATTKDDPCDMYDPHSRQDILHEIANTGISWELRDVASNVVSFWSHETGFWSMSPPSMTEEEIEESEPHRKALGGLAQWNLSKIITNYVW